MHTLSAFLLAALTGLSVVPPAQAQNAAAPSPLNMVPADRRASASQSALLAAARAGDRLVAVGERGVVLLSDDGGRQWRQARQVPASATLTGVSFANARLGWAVGHWGLVLHTRDGGDTWQVQREDRASDQPLLAVHFSSPQHGVAVGLWSLVLVTRDGGQRWEPVRLAAPANASDNTDAGGDANANAKAARPIDLNLYSLFPGRQGELFATAEQGKLLRSPDGGQTWQALDTGYAGSLWAGVALRNGDLLVGGLRGTLLRSSDQGRSWTRVAHDGRSSITGLHAAEDGSVVATGLDGLVLFSADGQRFALRPNEDRTALTGTIAGPDRRPLLLSRAGVRPMP